MAISSIEWTEKTWNPTTGCTKVSQGCKHCYAEIMHRRLQAMGQDKYSQPFTTIVCHDSELDTPLKWKKPTMIFVNSMSDIFHADVPLSFIQRIFKTMNATPQHTYQVLTKRPERMASLSPHLVWTPNIWAGTSIETNKVISRIYDLRRVPAHIRFLSIEPYLGPIYSLQLHGIHWVIVGGESGSGARPMKKEWVDDIFWLCQNSNTPFFFKQWGGINKKTAGRLYRGQEWNEMPTVTAAPAAQTSKAI